MPDFMFFPAVSSVYLVQHEYEILREAKVKINKYMLIIFLSRLLNIHPISHPNTLVFVVAEPVALNSCPPVTPPYTPFPPLNGIARYPCLLEQELTPSPPLTPWVRAAS